MPIQSGCMHRNIEPSILYFGTPVVLISTQNEDGSWSFWLTLDDDPIPIESDWTFPSKELAEEQVNYTLDSAALRIAEG